MPDVPVQQQWICEHKTCAPHSTPDRAAGRVICRFQVWVGCFGFAFGFGLLLVFVFGCDFYLPKSLPKKRLSAIPDCLNSSSRTLCQARLVHPVYTHYKITPKKLNYQKYKISKGLFPLMLKWKTPEQESSVFFLSLATMRKAGR